MKIYFFEYEIFDIFLHVVHVFRKFYYFFFFSECIFMRLNFSEWKKWNLNRDFLFSSNMLLFNKYSLDIFTRSIIV